VFEYTVSGGNVSRWPGRRGSWRLSKQPGGRRRSIAGAYCLRRFREAGPGVTGALARPGRCWQAAIRPSRLMPRSDRTARAVCPRAASAPRGSACCPAAGAVPCLPGARDRLLAGAPCGRRLSATVPSKTRTARAMTSARRLRAVTGIALHRLRPRPCLVLRDFLIAEMIVPLDLWAGRSAAPGSGRTRRL